MTIYWPETQPVPEPESEHAEFVLELPEEVLQRHGARILRPTTAASVQGDPAPRSTAYLSSVLLIPRDVVDTQEKLDKLEAILETVEMELSPPAFNPDLPPTVAQPVVLRPLGTRPVVVDAWVALQAIRHSTFEGKERIGLDHLMLASLTGDLGGVPGAIQGFVPPFGPNDPAASGYLAGSVSLEMPPIVRQDPAKLKLGRRAVVAVLDTGVGQNSRLEIPQVTPTPFGIGATGQYVKADGGIQAVVEQAGDALVKKGFRVEVIRHAKDEPLARNPLVGTQAVCFGHGLFCAGVIQQIAPDATVLAIRVMGSDGVAREDAVVAALSVLVGRVDHALKTGDTSRMVDVVSMSMGYPHEGSLADEETSPVAVQINALRDRGVIVVAAAGNEASSGRFFPACMSTHAATLTTPPVINVGALNPNGSKALYGNDSKAVSCFASSTNVVSTFPQDANASRQPLVRVPSTNRADLPQFRQSPDTDDHTHSPYAVWSGTSFAAPHVAAHLANALHDMVAVGATEIARKEDARNRAAEAVKVVKAAAQPKP